MNINLTELAKKILNENTWGDSPSAGAPTAPGRSPTAVTPSPSPNNKAVDILSDFNNFKAKVQAEEDKVKKQFIDSLSKTFLNKNVTAKASRGSMDQYIVKDYTFTVTAIDVRYVHSKDKYYVVFSGTDDKGPSEYYIEDSKIQVDLTPANSGTGADLPPQAPIQESGLRSLGGLVYPQAFNLVSKNNLNGK